MTNCPTCGTTTGIHGFSFDERAHQYRETHKPTAGILMIPESLIPDDETEDEFVSKVIEMLGENNRPEIKIIKNES